MRLEALTDGPFTPDELSTLDGVEACVHCGLCLPVCPTYELLGTQMDSPRGRLLLIKAAAEGTIPLSETFSLHMERCLVCRACETVCPSGVTFGRAMEGARAALQRTRETAVGRPKKSAPADTLRRLLFKNLLPRPNRMRLLARAIWVYETLGLRGFLRKTGILKRVRMGGTPLDAMDGLLPEFPPDLSPLPRRTPAQGEKRGQVILFTGCVMDMLFRKVHRDTIRCLSANGYEVMVTENQVCCGALQAHGGGAESAKGLARQNIDAFSGDESVVVNSAGCGAMLKEYGHLLENDPQYGDRARAFSERVSDVSELLADAGLRPPTRPFAERVTYQDACHLAHGQGVRTPPRELLRAVPGLEWVDLPRSDWCCGSAGIYNLTQPELANQLLEKKVNHIESTGASVVAVGNPGCSLQIEMGLRRRGLAVRVMHPVEILAEAYGPPDS
jgi:glycolate oxidase iron-sulfur subunit